MKLDKLLFIYFREKSQVQNKCFANESKEYLLFSVLCILLVMSQ